MGFLFGQPGKNGEDANLTIKSNDPNATLESKAKEYGLEETLGQPPPPDLTDEMVKTARRRQMLRLQESGGRRATFLTGPNGASGMPSLGAKTFLGG